MGSLSTCPCPPPRFFTCLPLGRRRRAPPAMTTIRMVCDVSHGPRPFHKRRSQLTRLLHSPHFQRRCACTLTALFSDAGVDLGRRRRSRRRGGRFPQTAHGEPGRPAAAGAAAARDQVSVRQRLGAEKIFGGGIWLLLAERCPPALPPLGDALQVGIACTGENLQISSAGLAHSVSKQRKCSKSRTRDWYSLTRRWHWLLKLDHLSVWSVLRHSHDTCNPCLRLAHNALEAMASLSSAIAAPNTTRTWRCCRCDHE